RTTEHPDGGRLIDQEWVQINLARVRAGIEYLTLLNWKVASLEAAGEAVNPADASSIKVFGTEFFTDAYRLLAEIVGQPGNLASGPGAALASRLNRGAQGTLILTFGGGVNEVQRDLIAMFGHQMPRTPRM
ncbi:MAG: acyl-CoA dehydrogenase, partial [Acidimicrobiia bacterium]|nr:acyl-CoA dehydrogenase [Acidimicrobiia bacterium]